MTGVKIGQLEPVTKVVDDRPRHALRLGADSLHGQDTHRPNQRDQYPTRPFADWDVTSMSNCR